MQKIKLNNYAVSEVVSTVLVIAIVLGTVATILAWGVPYMQEKQSESQMQRIQSNYDDIDNSVNNLIMQGVGTKKSSIVNSYNDMSSLEIKQSSNKLIVYYSFNPDYDFNISGLDDDNSSFKINMVNVKKPIKADTALIYPLSMEEKSWFYNIPEQYYGKIYGNYICAQKFRPSEKRTSWNLSKVDLKISKYGIPTGNLYVSIYEKGSNPIVKNNYLKQVAISANNISTSMQSYTFNTTINLFHNKEYFLVLNTTGGNNYSNYYKWEIEDKYCCFNEIAYNGTIKDNGTINLNNLSNDIRYNCRFIYKENAPPSKAQITPIGSNFFSGTPIGITVKASDTDYGDSFRYIIVWSDRLRDNYITNDTTYYVSSDPPKTYHNNYIYPGSYNLKVITIDSYGNYAENITTIYIQSWNDAPEDLTSVAPYEATITKNNTIKNNYNSFKGNFRIDLFNSSNKIFTQQDGIAASTIGYTPFGRIWIFDLNCLSYSSTYSSGSFKVIYENGAILIEKSDQVNFKKYPTFFEETKVVSLRIINTVINTSFYPTTTSGKGTYKLTFDNLGSISREPFNNGVYNFKMQIFGDNSNHWINYYINNYNFSKKLTNQDKLYNNTIFYNEQGKFLFFDTSLIEVNLEGLK